MVSSPDSELREARLALCRVLRAELAQAKRDAEMLATVFGRVWYGLSKAARPNLPTSSRATLPE